MKDFIPPYQEALALRELGFDEFCFGYFRDGKLSGVNKWDRKDWEFHIISNKDITNITHEIVLAPTYAQAFRFFREKYKLYQYIRQYYGEKFYFHIEDMVHPRRWDEYTVEMLRSFNESTSQEESELSCLKKLIEIVKNK